MRLLIDTHALLWFLEGNEQVPRPMRALIDGDRNQIIVSAATGWEIATKHRLGKLPSAEPIASDIEANLLRLGFDVLPITMRHAQHAGALPGEHRDPFDRMLAAQAQLEGLVIISGDRVFDGFGVKRLW
ncbi:MAG: type II toxin-antitoxin system VapC family toxin [Alphaproteobacteria bacterium]|nr:type II toxin-antitoxin system VapC family toxin [Alphaproteobacteria bacterium]